MTVAELIERLSKCPPDAPVIVETETYCMGSSRTGMYGGEPADRQIDIVSDLETRVVISLVSRD